MMIISFTKYQKMKIIPLKIPMEKRREKLPRENVFFLPKQQVSIAKHS